MRVIVGDVGGSNCRLASYESGQIQNVWIQPTVKSGSLAKAIETYLSEFPLKFDAGCVAVAGPVHDNQAMLTNVKWFGSSADFPCVGTLVNDLEAAAFGTTRLLDKDVISLHDAEKTNGPQAIIGVGTGHGQALIFDSKVYPTESGHAEYAPASRELARFADDFASEHGRVRVEDVVSGTGISNLLNYALKVYGGAPPPPNVAAGAFVLANAGSSPACAAVLDWFSLSMGAVVGDSILRSMAKTVWICGGVAQKWSHVLQRPSFLKGLYDKRPMQDLIESCSVNLVLHPHLGLLGAATIAADLCESS